ncbi:DUF547 domain-containing protein [Pontibacter sp. 172403-2]|uniref:DUF547 domain-containing protein n=1 Tax=Pontibacter rufus TaxID=2791028 RepID=UPI0018AF6D3B|nr:DUF547 domain-containing protein [Pontibacter sp. 172403-2]MBF9254505.1 DUF547 domain-containing protein [Pontibacter sp. 172403-2]
MKGCLPYFVLFLLLLTPYGAVRASGAVTKALYFYTAPDFYTSLTNLLQEHVQEGRVNYKALLQHKKQLQQLVREISSYNLNGATASEQKAFYLNAYNVLVLQQVLQHYPVKSVKDIPGFFDKIKFKVAGQQLTLNELESKKLREPFHDARLHFALVCAAMSCPPLRNEAYTPAAVERQLEDQARHTLQHGRFIRVQPDAKRVLVSEIFKWYRPDFLAQASSVPDYINLYRQVPVPVTYTLDYYPYNWQLNDVSAK